MSDKDGPPIIEYSNGKGDWDTYDVGWYFWNETWSDAHGPFDTKVLAEEALGEYCKTL